jgi:hypothetical protein
MTSFLTGNKTRSGLLLGFSLLSMLVLLGRGILLVVQALIAWQRAEITFSGLAPSVLDALSMLVCAGLLLPLAIASLRHLQGKALPPAALPPVRMSTLLLLSALWLILFIAASLLTLLLDLGWLFAIPAFLLAMLIPVAIFAWIASGGLAWGSRRRLWAAFSLGMTGGTLLSLLAEYALVAVGVVLGALVLAVRPDLLNGLLELQQQVQNAGDMEELLTTLAPVLTRPWVFMLVLSFASLFAPLIEEAAKPLAVWILGRRLHAPAEGFALGALSGAGFALLEGLMAASGMAETPYFGIPARLASSLMHITLSGMVGWGIASALLEKRWGRLAAVFALSVSLHGMWNGSALLAVYGSLRFSLAEMTYDPVSLLSMVGGVGLLGLVFVLIAVSLPLLNQRLRQLRGDIIAPPASRIERTPDGLDSQGS